MTVLNEGDRVRLAASIVDIVERSETWENLVDNLPTSVLDSRRKRGKLSGWVPQSIDKTGFKARILSDAARMRLIDRATTAIRAAKTWESVTRQLLRIFAAAARKFGGM